MENNMRISVMCEKHATKSNVSVFMTTVMKKKLYNLIEDNKMKSNPCNVGIAPNLSVHEKNEKQGS